jgi:hypothetical protein
MGASCPDRAVGCPPESSGHILTTLSQPPEKTVVPSPFHAEQSTCTKQQQTVAVVRHCRQGQRNVAEIGDPCVYIELVISIIEWYEGYRLVVRDRGLRLALAAGLDLPAPNLHQKSNSRIASETIMCRRKAVTAAAGRPGCPRRWR